MAEPIFYKNIKLFTLNSWIKSDKKELYLRVWLKKKEKI